MRREPANARLHDLVITYRSTSDGAEQESGDDREHQRDGEIRADH
jgi:hypothetical protein